MFNSPQIKTPESKVSRSGRAPAGSAERGFSLVETLVAIVIMSIGLLGVAGLQATSLRISHDSHLRSQATEFTHDLISRIRANSGADYTVGIPGAAPACIGDVTCTPAQIRNFDLFTWNNSLQAQFPNAVPTITASAVPGVDLQITITWYDRLEGLAKQNDDLDPVAVAEPRIYTISVRI
ncbi:MAG: type IV pilus modification protein PilV [Gammaproteobacteria bacterium]|nr:type IV pilus modification protein PilV [Gammaproteobacteria bacterium]